MDKILNSESISTFAVFGDIHGRISLMYALVELYERYENTKIDGILQVGDIGAFPDLTKLDSSTKRYAEKDSDELGFHEFTYKSKESSMVFENKDRVRSFLIRGNHEDFEYINAFRKPTHLDPWNKLLFIPDTKTVKPSLDGYSPTIAGFGGIHPREEQRTRGKKNKQQYRKSKKLAQSDPRFFSEKTASEAFQGEEIDILLTHAGPVCDELIFGSEYLTALDERVMPRVHLFGHHHEVIGPKEGPGGTMLVGLEHLDFDRTKRIREGSWGLLRIDRQNADFNFVNANEYKWVNAITRENYRTLAFDT